MWTIIPDSSLCITCIRNEYFTLYLRMLNSLSSLQNCIETGGHYSLDWTIELTFDNHKISFPNHTNWISCLLGASQPGTSKKALAAYSTLKWEQNYLSDRLSKSQFCFSLEKIHLWMLLSLKGFTYLNKSVSKNIVKETGSDVASSMSYCQSIDNPVRHTSTSKW